MSKYLWLLDFGHGGMTSTGHYTTAPEKMHKFPNGKVIYEGVINRKIGARLMRKLGIAGIRYVQIADDIEDTPLAVRVAKADKIFATDRSCIYLSIHSNAGGGKGFEVFTSPGQTKSDKVAAVFCKKYQQLLPQFPFRKDLSDGDDDKEADFYVLRKTDCPAVLVENLFFDNEAEADYLLSDAGQENIAEVLFQAIKEIETMQI